MPDINLIVPMLLSAASGSSDEPFVLVRLGEYVRDRCGDRITTAWFGVAVSALTGLVALFTAEIPKHLKGAPVCRWLIIAVGGIASVSLVVTCIILAAALALTPEPHEPGHSPTWAGPMLAAIMVPAFWVLALKDRISRRTRCDSPLLHR